MSSIKVNDYAVTVNLGWTLEERKVPQEVRISFELRLASRPIACDTDQLQDTICYETIFLTLEKALAQKSFRTIERLNQYILDHIKQNIPSETRIQVNVHKVRPPLPKLLGGVTFSQDTFE